MIGNWACPIDANYLIWPSEFRAHSEIEFTCMLSRDSEITIVVANVGIRNKNFQIMIYIGLAIDADTWISIENEKITHLLPCRTLCSIIWLDVNAEHLQSTPRYRYSRTWVIAPANGKMLLVTVNQIMLTIAENKTGSLSADFIEWS